MGNILDLYNKLETELTSNPTLERALQSELTKIVSAAYNQAMGSDEGYCFKFNLPLLAVKKLYTLLNITIEETYDAFLSSWGSNAFKNAMYKDSYYHILLLILMYGVRQNKKYFIDNSFIILFLKIWNGRKSSLIPFCDKRIMKYVVSNMCTNRHSFSKFDGPLSLIREYLVPTMLTKYKERIRQGDIQVIISQSFARVRQMFGFNNRTDIETGKKIAQGGILPLYMKAKQDGLAINAPSINGINDEEGDSSPSFDQYATTSNRDEIINTTSESITMSPNPKYPDSFIEQLRLDTKVKNSTIKTVLISLHNHQYHDIIHDLLTLILSKTNVNQKEDICLPQFMENVKKSIISSKNNADSNKLRDLCHMLLEPMLKDKINREFKTFSDVNQIQLRKVIFYGLIYNLRKNMCHNIS